MTIENFRGFAEEKTIELGASATILSGPNGKGKTSFFDAVQWLLLGSILRLKNISTKRSGDYITNRFDARDASRVGAELDVGGRVVQVWRIGDEKVAPLEWHEGGEVLKGPHAEAELARALLGDPAAELAGTVLTSGLLEQDVVRAVLEDEPKKRYRHMANFLGLQEVAGFEAETKRQAEEAGKRASSLRDKHASATVALNSDQSELDRLRQRLISQPEIGEARRRLTEAATSLTFFQIVELPGESTGVVSLAQQARRLRATAQELLQEGRRLNQAEHEAPKVDPEQVATLQANAKDIEEKMLVARDARDRAQARHREAEERSSRVAELAARALPLLGDSCPVCGQTIDAGDVRSHLEELLLAENADLTTLAEGVVDAETHLRELASHLERLTTKRSELESAALAATATIDARSRWVDRCWELARAASVLSPDRAEAIAGGDEATLAELASSADRLAGIADELAAVLGGTGLGEEVERRADRVRQLTEEEAELKQLAAAASREAEEAKTLSGAATRAIAGVTKKRFAALQPLVDDIFRRLDPHPAFTDLGFELGVAYRSGVADPFVHDPESNVTADPLLVLSSSQANVAALTYFLALSWAADRKALPFMLLDDPLQSMDDINALGFADLCRHLRQRRQLVVSTHERRLANLLERKLVPRAAGQETRVVKFTGWDRSGPVIESEEIGADEPAAFVVQAS